MSRTLLTRLLLFLPIALGVVAVNRLVDPGIVFRDWRADENAYERQIAALSVAGSNAAGVWNFQERLVLRFIEQSTPDAPEVLVLGSSRMRLAHKPRGFPGTFLNAAVSGASMTDLVTLYHMFAHRPGGPPRLLILGIDPWMFNVPAPIDLDRYTLTPEYIDARRSLGLPAPHIPSAPSPASVAGKKLRTLVSPSYFQLSLRYFATTRGRRAEVRATTDSESVDPIRRSDGSVTYEAAVRLRSPKDVEEVATADASANPIYNLGGFAAIDSGATAELTAILQDAGRSGTRVRIILWPYHPTAYKAITEAERYANVLRADSLIRHLATRFGASVVGDYDPARAGFSRTDFYDGMHANDRAASRLVARAVGDSVRP